MKESLKFRKQLAGGLLVTMGGLSLVGCSGSSEAAPVASRAVTDAKGPISVSVQYFANGTREIDFTDSTNPDAFTYLGRIFEFCDNKDLVEETFGGSYAGNALQRSADYPACADGKLTPTDFPPVVQ